MLYMHDGTVKSLWSRMQPLKPLWCKQSLQTSVQFVCHLKLRFHHNWIILFFPGHFVHQLCDEIRETSSSQTESEEEMPPAKRAKQDVPSHSLFFVKNSDDKMSLFIDEGNSKTLCRVKFVLNLMALFIFL